MASRNANAGWSKSLHDLQGTGIGSRIHLDPAKLEEHGWSVVLLGIGNKQLLTFIDPEGRRHKGARDIERKLESEGT